MYVDLIRELKTIDHEGYGDTDIKLCSWNYCQKH